MKVTSVLISWQLAAVLISQASMERSKRIRKMIGGRNADRNDWASILSLTFTQPNPRWKICSATAIDEMWLVTAAHCVDDIQGSPQYLQVNMNHNQTAKHTSTLSKRYGVQEIIVHPMHGIVSKLSTNRAYSWDFDIALIKLNESLPKQTKADVVENGRTNVTDCKSAGWGSYNELDSLSDVSRKSYKISETLKEIQVPLIPWKACYDFRTKSHEKFALINYHVICGGAVGIENDYRNGGCIGDSGSPLLCSSTKGRVLYGILLGGNPFCRQGIDYMIFTKVVHYKAWFLRHINGHRKH